MPFGTLSARCTALENLSCGEGPSPPGDLLHLTAEAVLGSEGTVSF
jgi:hypothetical protein